MGDCPQARAALTGVLGAQAGTGGLSPEERRLREVLTALHNSLKEAVARWGLVSCPK